MSTLLSGNEAIARGAWEAGVRVAAGYPGTPSTEVLEHLVTLPGVACEWAPNEKVALEVGVGASFAGARVLVTMKHVGMNVAADALMTAAYTGVGGGLVVLVADDPGMHSSQNEQDSRRWGPFGKVVVLEPSDSAEALTMAREAFSLSERLDMPVILRSTTRVSHGKGLVEVGERRDVAPAAFHRDPAKWVMMPAGARRRRADLNGRLERAAAESETSPFNEIEARDASTGVVTSGVAFQYVREALPEASTLKLGMTFPLPEGLIRSFAASVDRLYVVEELDPYLADAIRAMGIEVADAGVPRRGELSPSIVAAAFGLARPEMREPMSDEVPPRPPMLCPGCPHRGVFHALRELGAVVTGDIGCYTLGAMAPLSAMDSCVCMGASIGMAHGFALAGAAEQRPVVAVIGDSTFAHSGLTGVLNAVYNGGSETIVVLDNRITAMTGHQDNPFTGRTLSGAPAPEIDIETVVRALGVTDVRSVDPNLLRPTMKAIAEAAAHPGVSVVIAKAPCVLITRERGDAFAVDAGRCTACGVCVSLGCPAISRDEAGRATVDAELCVGCRQCVQVCRYGAIVRGGRTCEVKA